jgi:very-short-patch-repair endonuclease
LNVLAKNSTNFIRFRRKRQLLFKLILFSLLPTSFSLSRARKLNNALTVFAGEGRGEGKMTNLLLKHARTLRKNQTDTENYLWYLLKDRRLNNYKFRRQHPIAPYIVDFICIPKKLIIELDGGQHAQAIAYDEQRTEFFKMKGYKVLRFWNHDVFQETESVINMILTELGVM